MPARDYQAFWKDLKHGPLERVYYFYGSTDVLKDEALAALLDQALDPGLRDFNLDIRTASRLQPEEVSTLCATLPMMAERRVVVIRDVEGWNKRSRGRTATLAYLERPSPESVLVLVQGGGDPDPDPDLVKRTYAVEFGPMRRDHAARWAAHRAGQLGVALEPAALEHLLVAVDNDLGAAASELAKLAGLGDQVPVTVAQVESMLGVRHGETQYDWRDAVIRGEPGTAAAMLPHVLAQPGMSGVKLVTLLGSSLIGLGIARSHYDTGTRGSRLEQAVFQSLRRARVWGIDYKASAREWATAAPKWSSARIRDALRDALAADQALKSTTISDDRGILTDLVLGLGLSRREAA